MAFVLWFRDFHDDLIWLLRHAIVCDATVYLLQPERSGSMREFIRKAQPFFDIEEIRDYNSQVEFLIILSLFMMMLHVVGNTDA